MDAEAKVGRVDYEQEITKRSNQMKSLEKSRDRIREQIESLENWETTIKDAYRVVGEIHTGPGDLQNLTFEQKKAIVDKIYALGSIELFPRWYLESDSARVQNPMLFQDEWWKTVRPSSMEMKKGPLTCFGVIKY